MGGMLIEGQWRQKNKWEREKDGSFSRQVSAFREWVSEAPGARFAPEAGRYHLYVSLACPWANRVLIVRELMGLQDVLSVSTVHYLMLDDGWVFDPDADESNASTADHIFGARCLHEVYTKANETFTGRVTVPILWDKKHKTIVNNESSEIIRMLATTFASLGTNKEIDLYPEHLRGHIDATIDEIYNPINNGVYRCGFAGSQGAYDAASAQLFEALDHWNNVTSTQRYLCGELFTLADICMFTTLVRFDPVYYVHFKCNHRLIAQYTHLSGYLRELYQVDAIRETVNMHHIKSHYYRSHTHINPTQIVPRGPEGSLDLPHERGHLSSKMPWA